MLYLFPKKQSKSLLKNCRSISLLPIFSKIYERIIFNKELFNHYHQNQLFTKCLSGFLSGDSYHFAVIIYRPQNKCLLTVMQL